MLRIAIVEDDPSTRQILQGFVEQYAAEQGLECTVTPYEDGAQIAAGYHPGYDIIFMDVEMPGMGGFSAAAQIRAVDSEAVLVFVTNMAQYAIRGYEVDALDYVLKPVDYYQFSTKLSRAIQRVQRQRGGQILLQCAGGGVQLVETSRIYYLETHSRMLHYHTADGEFTVRSSLQNAESPIPEMGGTPIDRLFYRSRQCLPAGKTPLWYPSPSLESGLRYYFLFLGLVP